LGLPLFSVHCDNLVASTGFLFFTGAGFNSLGYKKYSNWNTQHRTWVSSTIWKFTKRSHTRLQVFPFPFLSLPSFFLFNVFFTWWVFWILREALSTYLPLKLFFEHIESFLFQISLFFNPFLWALWISSHSNGWKFIHEISKWIFFFPRNTTYNFIQTKSMLYKGASKIFCTYLLLFFLLENIKKKIQISNLPLAFQNKWFFFFHGHL
jgi:hypothetical protein